MRGIGIGTVFNINAGFLGEKLGVPYIKLSGTTVPNIFGPSGNIFMNAAGNAGGDATTKLAFPDSQTKK